MSADDIVKRLRNAQAYDEWNLGTDEISDARDAAEEIVRLRAENEKLRATLDGTTQFCPRCVEKDAEIERLQKRSDYYLRKLRTYVEDIAGPNTDAVMTKIDQMEKPVMWKCTTAESLGRERRRPPMSEYISDNLTDDFLAEMHENKRLRDQVARLTEALRPFVDGLAFDDDEPDRCGWCAYLLTNDHHHRCPMPAAAAALAGEPTDD